MKVAIIGGTGLLGSNLVKLYSTFDVRAFSRRNSENIDIRYNNIIDFNKLDLELTEYFQVWKPDIIVNTVAIVNLEKCEDDYELAYYTNCILAKNIAIVAKKFSSYFIHISTDHYYNDTYHKHTEDSKVLLLNNYAKTKYAAEKEVLKVNNESLIVRTNIIGFRRNNKDSFFEWLIKSLEKQEIINLYTNFLTSPISAAELGEILEKCYQKRIFGTYNIASSEIISKYTFGIKVAEVFCFSMDSIVKAEMLDTMQSSLIRALTLGLDTSKIECALNTKMPTIYETLNVLLKEYEEIK